MKTQVLALAIALFPGVAFAQGFRGAPPQPRTEARVEVRPSQHVWVNSGPPAPMVEVRPAASHEGAVWVPGYWHWNARRYVWVGGRWSAPRPGYVWEAPRYERHGRRWGYETGHWRRR